MKGNLYWRPIAGFIGIDLVTYLVLYALVLPPLAPAVSSLDPVIIEATEYLLIAIRIGFIGAIITRWIRNGYGLLNRSAAVPTIVVAAILSWIVQMLLTFLVNISTSGWAWNWEFVIALFQWVVFALIGALFIRPGEAEKSDRSVPLKFTVASDRGAVSMFLVPAIAVLVAGTLAVILIVGTATNNRRGTDTAADAAALAAGKVWKDSLHNRFSTALESADSSAFWGLAGSSISAALPYDEMRSAASEYAQRNDAYLAEFHVDQQRASVRVQVRHDGSDADDNRVGSMAESTLRFRSGLCNSWGVLGYKINGMCVTTAPLEEPEDEPDPEDSDGEEEEEVEEEPFEPPNGLSNWNVEVTLSDAG